MLLKKRWICSSTWIRRGWECTNKTRRKTQGSYKSKKVKLSLDFWKQWKQETPTPNPELFRIIELKKKKKEREGKKNTQWLSRSLGLFRPCKASHKSVVQVMSNRHQVSTGLQSTALCSVIHTAETPASESCSSCKYWWQWSLLSLFADGLALLIFNLPCEKSYQIFQERCEVGFCFPEKLAGEAEGLH